MLTSAKEKMLVFGTNIFSVKDTYLQNRDNNIIQLFSRLAERSGNYDEAVALYKQKKKDTHFYVRNFEFTENPKNIIKYI